MKFEITRTHFTRYSTPEEAEYHGLDVWPGDRVMTYTDIHVKRGDGTYILYTEPLNADSSPVSLVDSDGA